MRRQIDWLASAGWNVDSLGLGESPTDTVRTHFPLADLPRPARPRIAKALIHVFLPYRTRFRVLSESRIPHEVGRRISAGEYDLIIFNDTHLIPWMANKKVFNASSAKSPFHLDLHEYHPPVLPQNAPWRSLVGGYHKWKRNFIGSPRFATRSVVVRAIGELYESEFDIPQCTVVRNAPPYVELSPSPVDPNHIQLVHHGAAAWPRGLAQMAGAMRLLDDRFRLILMLVGNQAIIDEYRLSVSDLGDRVTFRTPVPMTELPVSINEYDLEIMFFPPTTVNLHFVLPNKLFEAVQGRLGLVIGPSPMMVEVVEEFGIGVVTEGWEAEDLAAALNSITGEQITAMKHAADRAAKELSAESERNRFFHSLDHAILTEE